jgi:hypothetical protein
MSAIVEFLEGRGVDGAGRDLSDVLALGLAELEGRHDFIQWLFPLTEPSAAVSGSPVLSAKDVNALRASPVVQANLVAAARRMGSFYEHTDHWLRAGDHNHLRITRIIKSLRLLVGDGEADRFRQQILAMVAAQGAPVSAVSLRYWMEA